MASWCSVWVSWQTAFYCSVWVRWRLGSDQQLWRQPMDASMPVNFAIPVFEQRHALDEWNNIQCSSVIVHQSSMHLNGFLIHVKWRALYRACHRRKTCYPSESARYMYMYVYIPTYKTNMYLFIEAHVYSQSFLTFIYYQSTNEKRQKHKCRPFEDTQQTLIGVMCWKKRWGCL